MPCGDSRLGNDKKLENRAFFIDFFHRFAIVISEYDIIFFKALGVSTETPFSYDKGLDS